MGKVDKLKDDNWKILYSHLLTVVYRILKYFKRKFYWELNSIPWSIKLKYIQYIKKNQLSL